LIAVIEGRIIEINENSVVVDVNGLGYEVMVTDFFIGEGPGVGEKIRLFTHLYVREDLVALYGFRKKVEKEIFLQLLSVSRVGPSAGLTILSSISVYNLKSAIYNKDVARLTEIKGVGKKTAERLILELKEKIDFIPQSKEEEDEKELVNLDKNLTDDAVEALVGLGYDYREAEEVVNEAGKDLKDDKLTVERLIKRALQKAAR